MNRLIQHLKTFGIAVAVFIAIVILVILISFIPKPFIPLFVIFVVILITTHCLRNE